MLVRYFPIVILSMACNGRQPLPGGPPPEYEPPRTYEPKTNIDKPGSEPDAIDKLLEEKPTESEAPPDAGAPPAPEPAPK